MVQIKFLSPYARQHIVFALPTPLPTLLTLPQSGRHMCINPYAKSMFFSGGKTSSESILIFMGL